MNPVVGTLQRIPAVVGFEWRRALTVPRMAWMIALTAFPPCLLAMVKTAASPSELPVQGVAIMIFILSPCVVCILGVFLWATPALSSELEGRSWVYLAVRPYGPIAVLLGKYLVAVSWTVPVGLVSSILAIRVSMNQDWLKLLVAECGLVVLSCMAYSALFLLIGVLAPKRSMVAGIFYTIVFEVTFALIPAAVNMLTVQYRLRCLLVRWMDFDKNMGKDRAVILAYFGDESAIWHVAILVGMTVFYLIAAAAVLRFREFTSSLETES